MLITSRWMKLLGIPSRELRRFIPAKAQLKERRAQPAPAPPPAGDVPERPTWRARVLLHPATSAWSSPTSSAVPCGSGRCCAAPQPPPACPLPAASAAAPRTLSTSAARTCHGRSSHCAHVTDRKNRRPGVIDECLGTAKYRGDSFGMCCPISISCRAQPDSYSVNLDVDCPHPSIAGVCLAKDFPHNFRAHTAFRT